MGHFPSVSKPTFSNTAFFQTLGLTDSTIFSIPTMFSFFSPLRTENFIPPLTQEYVKPALYQHFGIYLLNRMLTEKLMLTIAIVFWKRMILENSHYPVHNENCSQEEYRAQRLAILFDFPFLL